MPKAKQPPQPQSPSTADSSSAAPGAALAEALAPLREAIDAVDNELIELLNKRARIAQEVGVLKAKSQARMYVPERELQLLNRLVERSPGPLSEESLRLIYKEIISACLALESPLQVAFLGPEATFTHEATKRHFGLSAKLTPRRRIADVFADVESGRAAYGVVPIENTMEGVVNHTLDSFMDADLCICAEVLMQVSHHLLTRTGDTGAATKVYADAQALAQCRGWLEDNLGQVTMVDVPNTARAAQLAAEDPTAAALATDLAASMYGMRIAASHLDDRPGNMTRFLVIGREHPAPTGNDRTSIMFALRDSPGILFEALRALADRGINMSRIESRPSRRQAWEYLFFIDLEGHQDVPQVADAIAALGTTCAFMKVLGSYPRGELWDGKSKAPR